MGKADHPLCATSNRSIPFKNPYIGLKCSCVVCVAVIWLLFAVFYVTGAVHKSGSRFVVNGTPNKWQPVERSRCSERDLCFFYGICTFSPDRNGACSGICSRCTGQMNSPG